MSALSTSKTQLQESQRKLSTAIRDTKKEWNDPVQERFEKLTIGTVDGPINQFQKILENAGRLMDQAFKEIGET